MNYMGGGLLARLGFNVTARPFLCQQHTRVGNVHNHYNGGDLKDGLGRSASFDSDVPYYGMHAGAGYVWNITEDLSLDMYSKYFWTIEPIPSRSPRAIARQLQAVDSNRLRLGARMSYGSANRSAPMWVLPTNANLTASTSHHLRTTHHRLRCAAIRALAAGLAVNPRPMFH